MKITLHVMALMAFAYAAGSSQPSYPVDSSYTIDSAYEKLKKSHPETQRTEPLDSITIWRDQTYKRIGQRHLEMDVYRMSGDAMELRPAVILVHGGGWASGDRSMWYGLAERLAKRGYVTATVSYRLSPEAPFPASVHDIRESVRWLRSNAFQFGIDEKWIFIAGGSSGGQVASLLGLSFADAQLDEYASNAPELGAVQGIVNIDGLSSFVDPVALKYENDRPQPSPAGRWLGGSYEQVPEVWIQASPVQYVNESSPPMLFFRSKQARFTAGLGEMRAKLDRYGISNELVEYPDAPHSFWLFDPWVSATADRMHEFMQRVVAE